MMIKILARKKEILDEIESLEKDRQSLISQINKISTKQIELKGAFNELNKLEGELKKDVK